MRRIGRKDMCGGFGGVALLGGGMGVRAVRSEPAARRLRLPPPPDPPPHPRSLIGLLGALLLTILVFLAVAARALGLVF